MLERDSRRTSTLRRHEDGLVRSEQDRTSNESWSEMQLDVELGSYSRVNGLRLSWVPGYSLRVRATGDEVVIDANEQGLRSLAQHLWTLADGQVPTGVHAHLEPHLELDDDSLTLILDKH